MAEETAAAVTLASDLARFDRQVLVDLGCLGGVNLVVVLVRLCQLAAVEHQAAKAVVGGQFKLGVHLDGFKGAHLDADLAAHADGNVDVETRGIILLLADSVRLFVFRFLDEDALGRALFLTDLAGNAAHARLPVVSVKDKEREDARGLDRRGPLFRILDRRETVGGEIAADKVSCRFRHAFQDAFA